MSRVKEEMKETLEGVENVLGNKIYKTTITLDGYVLLPDELIQKLGWKEGDELRFEFSDVCEDTFEHDGIVVSNLTKHKEKFDDEDKDNSD